MYEPTYVPTCIANEKGRKTKSARAPTSIAGKSAIRTDFNTHD